MKLWSLLRENWLYWAIPFGLTLAAAALFLYLTDTGDVQPFVY